MIILLTNDDGIYAPGLRALRDAVRDLGDVWIVAPLTEQSGTSSSFSLINPLRMEKVYDGDTLYGYGIGGTPADSVKMAMRQILPEPPALVMSGINRGDNSGVNVIYSGTVAAALEGAVLDIPSIAISFSRYSEPYFDVAASYAREFALKLLEHGLPPYTMLNVNVPPLTMDEIKGVRLTRQAKSHYAEEIDKRNDPRGFPYYWIGGINRQNVTDKESDIAAVRDGYVSVTPLHADLTNHQALDTIGGWLND